MYTNVPDANWARELFDAGRFADVIRGSLRSLNEGRLTPEHQVLVAQALLHAGDTVQAVAIADRANHPGAAASVRSSCELVIGLATRRAGDLRAARSRLQEAIRLARDAGDLKQEAWTQAHRFRVMIEYETQDVTKAFFVDTRRLVMKAADPHLSAFLHIGAATLDGQTGRLEEARRHLEIAASLLKCYPHAWLEQLVEYNLLCLSGAACKITDAARHAAGVRRLREIAGSHRSDHALNVNEAHIDVLGGRFERSHKTLRGVIETGRGLTAFAATEGLARLYLALNALSSCEAALSMLLNADTRLGIAECYLRRSAAVVRTKLLIRRNQLQAAVDYARRERANGAAAGDRSIVATLAALEAEALAHGRDLRLAGIRLFDASEYGATDGHEYLGQYYDACSRVLEASSCDLAPLLRDRARRIWRSQGNVWARVESDSRGGPELPIRDMTFDMFRDDPPTQFDYGRDARLTAAHVLDAACAALDLSSDPRLVCSELTAIATALGCADHVSVAEVAARAAQHPRQAANTYVAVLNILGGKQIELRCTPAEDPVTNIALGNLLRIARAAGTLAQARLDERNRAALWPAEEIAAEDSLFIAEEMRTLAATARKVAPTNVTVLITGETGTGKEILARAVHAASARPKGPFLPFNCSAGPRDMIDAQLFGHRRGAFTGATEHAPGVIRAAAGGTLFLDEIGEAPLEVQTKLLRFLESGEIHPIGEAQPTRVDVRVIAATNVHLEAAVSSGRFREDLFYRLNIVRLHLPPLRERREEITAFAQHYLRKFAREFAKGELRLAEETVEYLLLFKWPGNVRQLANEMRRVAALAEVNAVLMPDHLSPDIVASRRTIPASERTLDANEVVVRLDQPLPAATEHLERVMIPYVLNHCEGRVEEAARRLGLSRKGLYLKRMRLGLEIAGPRIQTA